MVMLWSAVEESVFALVANGPIFRPLFFRGKDFAGDSNSGNRATGVTRSLHDIYEMTPKDNGVFSVVSSEPHKSAISWGNTMGVLLTLRSVCTRKILRNLTKTARALVLRVTGRHEYQRDRRILAHVNVHLYSSLVFSNY